MFFEGDTALVRGTVWMPTGGLAPKLMLAGSRPSSGVKFLFESISGSFEGVYRTALGSSELG